MKLRNYILFCLALIALSSAGVVYAADDNKDDLLGTEPSKADTSLIDEPQEVNKPVDTASEPVAADNTPVQAIEPKNPIVPDAQPQKILTDTNIISSTENPDVYVPFNGLDSETLHLDFKSLFYTPEQTDMIYSKMKKYKASGKSVVEPFSNAISNGVGNISDATAQQKVYEHKMYFLSSVLYPRDKNWTIWMNSQKIRMEDASTDPEIVNVEENYVTFIFRAGQDLINYSPNYQLALVKKDIDEPDPEFDMRSEDGAIQVSSFNGDVKFKLKQNQTFSLFDMAISEGFIAAAPATAVPGTTPVAAGVPPIPQVDQATKDLNLLQPVNGLNPTTNPMLMNNPAIKAGITAPSAPVPHSKAAAAAAATATTPGTTSTGVIPPVTPAPKQ